MLDNKINIGIYGLAVLPIDYLSRLENPFEQICDGNDIGPDYRQVFTVGIKGYQLITYIDLVREHYGRGVSNQINHYQQRLFDTEPGGRSLKDTITLINSALETGTVTADTEPGQRVEVPIEMNVALTLLLGTPSSPHCVSHPDQRAAEIGSMSLDIDWLLSQCLTRARSEMQRVFSPLLSCIDSGVRNDFVQTYLNDKLAVN